MKKSIFLFLVSLSSLSIWSMDAAMYQWRCHFAYGSVSQIVDAGKMVYGLSSGALYSVDKQTEEIQTYSKLNGLNGGEIVSLAYVEQSKALILTYADGLIDIYKNGSFTAMTDLQQKSIQSSKQPNKIVVSKGIAYFCMSFGIMAVDVNKMQIKDTYYIGDKGADVNVLDLTFDDDSLYAISSSEIYSIDYGANWMDYVNWHHSNKLSTGKSYKAITYWNNNLYALVNTTLMQLKDNKLISVIPTWKLTGICQSDNRLFLLSSLNGIFSLNEDNTVLQTPSPYAPASVIAHGSTYWLADDEEGIVRQTDDDIQSFSANGPLVNSPYRMRFCGEKMIMVPGGYTNITELSNQKGCVMLMDNGVWSSISHQEILDFTQKGMHYNFVDAIIDPSDDTHFYTGSIGGGLLEYKNNELYQWYYGGNSSLNFNYNPPERSTWISGFAYDSKGNLWMHNIMGQNAIRVIMKDGSWVSINHPSMVSSTTVGRARDLLIWNQNENIKIIAGCHTQRGLILLNDRGTITDQSDDQYAYVTSFVDQDNNVIQLAAIYSMAQDNSGALWVGTNEGFVVFDDPSTLFTSNVCRKIKIPRNDGTGLADYLLGTEQINAIVVDGANRKWIGTAASGVYLVSEDGLETIQHFTADNSPLIDNTIISIAIQPSTGRVFIGTSKGLMSFQSDAAPASDDYSNVYAYPNPIRPDFDGVITIRGLMDGSEVHIVDNAGNLVCKTRSNGGIAIWDGKTADGRRAASGVYIVFLNENNANQHAVTKILLMH